MNLINFGSIALDLGDILQIPENRAEVGQNHDARKTVSATLSVLK